MGMIYDVAMHWWNTMIYCLLPVLLVLGVVGVVVSALEGASKLNAEQTKMVGVDTHISQQDFLRFACKAKSICNNYPDIKQGCAAAGSIQKCIDIRMKGEDSSMCLDGGGIVGFDDNTQPSFAQCAAFQVAEFFRSYDAPGEQNIDGQLLKSANK